MTDKPVVLYRMNVYHTIPGIGAPAMVAPVNHPGTEVSNTCHVLTSPIVRVGEDGEFETRNTIYRPEK